MQNARWRAGRLSTGFIAEEFPDGFAPLAPAGESERILAAVAAHVDHVHNARKRAISGQFRDSGRANFDLNRVVMLGGARDRP